MLPTASVRGIIATSIPETSADLASADAYVMHKSVTDAWHAITCTLHTGSLTQFLLRSQILHSVYSMHLHRTRLDCVALALHTQINSEHLLLGYIQYYHWPSGEWTSIVSGRVNLNSVWVPPIMYLLSNFCFYGQAVLHLHSLNLLYTLSLSILVSRQVNTLIGVLCAVHFRLFLLEVIRLFWTTTNLLYSPKAPCNNQWCSHLHHIMLGSVSEEFPTESQELKRSISFHRETGKSTYWHAFSGRV